MSKWELSKETDSARTYMNKDTGSSCDTKLIYTDQIGNKWWGFNDLFNIPYLRKAYAQKISDLFSIGITLADLRTWSKKEKELLKSTDPEKYEKLYSLALEKENIVENTADPMKQHLALCTIYVLAEDERIDFYSIDEALKKLELWSLDIDLQAFFLNWHSSLIEHYLKGLENFSRTASSLRERLKLPSQQQTH